MYFDYDKQKMYMTIGILAAVYLMYCFATGKILDILYSIPGLLSAISIHEFAHATCAYVLGDDTAKRQGRISLNPLAHLDPVGIVFLLFFRFGWGKPVEVNTSNFKKNLDQEKANAIVSLARPLANFILAFFLIVIELLLYKTFIFKIQTYGTIILTMFIYAIAINISLGVFNLLPWPPLDGSKIFRPIFPNSLKNFFDSNELILNLILMFVASSGMIGIIISPAISYITKFLQNIAYLIVR